MNREDLVLIVEKAVQSYGGSASVVQVAQYIWKHHEPELKAAGNLFYTWQYDMRWAALKLRKMRRLAGAKVAPKGHWQIPPRHAL
ncbi:hypothetical protein C5688_15100 [Methylocystis sp. MitZ-2018]|nr:hypothetical protein C5688_15100 [Methylocystis sp. MitZ-2018]